MEKSMIKEEIIRINPQEDMKERELAKEGKENEYERADSSVEKLEAADTNSMDANDAFV